VLSTVFFRGKIDVLFSQYVFVVRGFSCFDVGSVSVVTY